jgi:hypothetical protein
MYFGTVPACISIQLVGSLKKNTTLEYSTRVVQEGDRRCEKSTLNDLAYLTPLRIPLMNPVNVKYYYHFCMYSMKFPEADLFRAWVLTSYFLTFKHDKFVFNKCAFKLNRDKWAMQTVLTKV